MEDVKRKADHYINDFNEPFRSSDAFVQCLGSIIFLFFSNLTTMVSFGGVMAYGTGHQIGAIECIVAASLCGVAFSLFSGQPLCILGPTGHTLVFEIIIFNLCQ